MPNKENVSKANKKHDSGVCDFQKVETIWRHKDEFALPTLDQFSGLMI